MLKRQICLLFNHKFASWEYVAENSCKQKRVCQRDGYTEERIASHEWKQATDLEKASMATRAGSSESEVCSRCGLIKIDRQCDTCGGYGYLYEIHNPNIDPSFYSVSYAKPTGPENAGNENDADYYVAGTVACSSCNGSGKLSSFYEQSQQ